MPFKIGHFPKIFTTAKHFQNILLRKHIRSKLHRLHVKLLYSNISTLLLFQYILCRHTKGLVVALKTRRPFHTNNIFRPHFDRSLSRSHYEEERYQSPHVVRGLFRQIKAFWRNKRLFDIFLTLFFVKLCQSQESFWYDTRTELYHTKHFQEI